MGASAATPDPDKSATIPGNTDKTKTEGDDKEKLSPFEVDLAVAELRYQTAFYLEACQAMMDGVTLGAEQVQDKRIEFLEAGPTTDPDAVIAMIALTLVLEGSIGPAIATIAVSATLRPIFRSSATAIRATRKRLAAPVLKDLRLYRAQSRIARKAGQSFDGTLFPNDQTAKGVLAYADACERAANALKQNFRGKIGAGKSVREALTEITDFTQNNLVAAAKAPVAVGTNLPGSDTPLTLGDSPSVEVQAAAMSSASKLRLTVTATHEALEAYFKHPDTTTAEVIKVLDEYRVDDSVNFSFLRESLQLATEALIWAKLLLDLATVETAIDRAERAAGRDLPEHLKDSAKRGLLDAPFLRFPNKLDEKMREYLMQRFSRELVRWIKERGKSIPIRNAWLLPGGLFQGQTPSEEWFKQLSDKERDDFLVQFLTEIQTAAPKEFKVR